MVISLDIQLLHLSKSFGQKQVLKDVQMTFIEGKMNCLMGASGSGKTTIINILMGFIKPDSGNIQGLEGKRISAVFQEDRLIEHWDAIDNVRLVCSKTVSIKAVEQEFNKVWLEDYKDKPVQKLSGGMRRRVAIVRAMLAKSNLVILDEPFKGLDKEMKTRVIQYVKEMTQGKTVIVITHEEEEEQQLGANQVIL